MVGYLGEDKYRGLYPEIFFLGSGSFMACVMQEGSGGSIPLALVLALGTDFWQLWVLVGSLPEVVACGEVVEEVINPSFCNRGRGLCKVAFFAVFWNLRLKRNGRTFTSDERYWKEV